MPLAPEVWSAARDSLLELFPLWLAQVPADFCRVLRPGGTGTYSINIEPYRGSTTWIGFYRLLETSTSVPKLQAAIEKSQPELASHLVLPGRSQQLGDCKALISTWCRALESVTPEGKDLLGAIDQLLSHVSDLLNERRLNHRSITAITGLQLPTSASPIELGNGAVLRRLTQEELVELGSHDITFGQHHDLMSHSVSSCVEINGSVPFTLEPTAPAALLTSTIDEEARRQVSIVMQALHVLKSGRAGIFLTTNEFTPALLPNLSGGSSWPLYRSPFASFEVSESDVSEFVRLHGSLRANTGDELRIATDRIVDAESRLSPVDALLDVVIGLEALLNPMDSAELAFRVALNYAFLTGAETRRERYERVRALQKTRNRVVHGGLNLQSPDAAVIHEHAGLAKACLRDSIKSFLLDPTLAGNRRLDADFWLDRVLPKNIVAPEGLPRALADQ